MGSPISLSFGFNCPRACRAVRQGEPPETHLAVPPFHTRAPQTQVHETNASSLRPGWRSREGGLWEYALGGLSRTADEWAAALATKPLSTKARPIASVPATAASALVGGAWPISGRPLCGGGAAVEEIDACFKWGVAVEVKGR